MAFWDIPPAAETPVPPQEVPRTYRYWRNRQLLTTYVGYVMFYCLRKNIPIAVPLLTKELGIGKAAFGAFFTAHDLVYGIAKFVAGTLADRYNPRFLLALGLALAAVANFAFSLGHGVAVLGIFWVLNGFFQGFGFPPSARILTHWFRPAERGLKWGIFNTSHQAGTIFILYLSGVLALHYGWRACFWVPAIGGLVTAVFLAAFIRDTPASLGLPEVESDWEREGTGLTASGEVGPAPLDDSGEPLAELVQRRVYRNPALWLACLGNFFVYSVRFGILNWAPTYLHEVKHVDLEKAGLITGSFEWAGLVGCLLAGWVTDRFFASRRSPACVAWMLACAVFLFLFWHAPEGDLRWPTFCLAGVGFTVYGPQFLGGLMSADLAGKRAAGTAVGFHGFFGYLSGFLSGIGMGAVAERWGWDAGFAVLVVCAVLGALSFVPIWNARPVEEGE